MEPRISRLAKNEALFREVNERVTAITETFAEAVGTPNTIDALLCECSDPVCLERVGPLTIQQYEEIRRDPTRFIIAAGHQTAAVERVIERQATYWIVEKNEGVPADLARKHDARS